MKRLVQGLSLLIAASILASSLAGCGGTPSPTPSATSSPSVTAEVTPTASETPASTPTTQPSPTAAEIPGQRMIFAKYNPVTVNVQPAVPAYQVPSDLSEVAAVGKYDLTAAEKQALAKNGFFVRPADGKEFYQVYEQLRYDEKPAFVTTDSALHIYHLIFDKLLRSSERENFVPALKDLTQALLDESLTDYKNLRLTPMENAAKRNVAFFAVAAKLQKMDIRLPDEIIPVVDQELALIDQHSGMINSPIFGYEEDYSQYIPRGHYTRSEDLQNYFRAMMWYGRLTFRLKSDNPATGREETKSALLIVKGLEQAYQGKALENWKLIYEPTSFFVGASDDLTYYDYIGLVDKVYGPDVTDEALADGQKLTDFINQAFQMRPPAINSMVIYQWQNRDDNTRGFRFMGQRFVLDAAVFQRLVYREVEDRFLPKGLDLMAALGSQEAYDVLDNEGDTKFQNYPSQMEKAKQSVADMQPEDWQANLYSAWLDVFRPLMDKPGDGYPSFMQNQAWVRKNLNTALGSWAELKHDTILYAKQVYAERGGGPSQVSKGYVEPNPEVFARLAALAKMTDDGLSARGLINQDNSNSLRTLTDNLLAFNTIAQKELANQPLTDDEYAAIEDWGATLEHLTIAAADPQDPSQTGRQFIESLDAAVVADVATDPNNGLVLEEGVGRIFEIFVVVPDGQGLKLTSGGVFSYYEFQQPQNERLTDETWKQMLDSGQTPPQPEWTGSFMVK